MVEKWAAAYYVFLYKNLTSLGLWWRADAFHSIEGAKIQEKQKKNCPCLVLQKLDSMAEYHALSPKKDTKTIKSEKLCISMSSFWLYYAWRRDHRSTECRQPHKKVKFEEEGCLFSTFFSRLQRDHSCAYAQKWFHFSYYIFPRIFKKIKKLRPNMTKIALRGPAPWGYFSHLWS